MRNLYNSIMLGYILWIIMNHYWMNFLIESMYRELFSKGNIWPPSSQISNLPNFFAVSRIVYNGRMRSSWPWSIKVCVIKNLLLLLFDRFWCRSWFEQCTYQGGTLGRKGLFIIEFFSLRDNSPFFHKAYFGKNHAFSDDSFLPPF